MSSDTRTTENPEREALYRIHDLYMEWSAGNVDDPWKTIKAMDKAASDALAAEAAQGAAPRAEGLDVERLARAINEHIETSCPQETACNGSCSEDIAFYYARLAPQERRD